MWMATVTLIFLLKLIATIKIGFEQIFFNKNECE